MDYQQHSSSIIGSSAKVDSNDKSILISEFQAALQDEIIEAKRQSYSRKTELFDGMRTYAGKSLHIYRFFYDDTIYWCSRTPMREVTVTIDGEDFFWTT